MDPCSGRRLIGEMAVNSHSQLVSLNQTAGLTRGADHPCWAAGYAGTPWEPSLDFRRRPEPQETSFMMVELVSSTVRTEVFPILAFSRSPFKKNAAVHRHGRGG